MGFQLLPVLPGTEPAPQLLSLSLSDKQGWYHPNPSTSSNFAYAAEKPWAGREEPQANSTLISHSSGQGLINLCRGGERIFLEAEWRRGWASNYADLLATSQPSVAPQGLCLPEIKVWIKRFSHQTHQLLHLLTRRAACPGRRIPTESKDHTPAGNSAPSTMSN